MSSSARSSYANSLEGKKENKNFSDKILRKQPSISFEAGAVTSSIFFNGMNAGRFTSQGTMKNMEECIHLCGKEMNCSAAFMILKYCFSVKCYTKESCGTRTAIPSVFNPRVSFITHFSSRMSPSGKFAVIQND